MVLAVWRDFNDLAAQRPRNGRVLAFGVDDDNVIVGRQRDVCNGVLHRYGFARTGHTEIERMGRDQPFAVTDQQIFGNGVDSVIQTAGVLNFLRTERHEDSAAFRGQRPQRVNPPQAIRQNRIQAALLLVTENRESAEFFLRDGLQRLRIRVKLLQAVRDMNERHTGEHEPLVTGGQIFQQVFRFGAHLLQVIGNRRCEIVLPVLPLLPACNVRFHAEDSALHLTHRFFGWNRKNVNGQQQVSGEVRQVLYHFVADKRCVVAHKKHPSKFAAHFKIPGAELQSVRANEIAEVDAALDVRRQVEPERRFFAGPEKVMQEPQPVGAGNGIRPGIQPPETGRQVGIHATEIRAGLLDFAQADGERDILFLHQVVTLSSFVQDDLVVLAAIVVQTVAALRHEHRALEVNRIQAAVDDRDFRGRVCWQRIENSTIRTEDTASVV